MRKSNLPTLSEINGDTFSKVTSVGLPLVVAAITSDNIEAANSIKNIAREMRSEGKVGSEARLRAKLRRRAHPTHPPCSPLSSQFVFSTVDRVTFHEWLKGFDKLKEGEGEESLFINANSLSFQPLLRSLTTDQYFVFDNDKKVYWVKEEGKSLKEFVRDVDEGNAEQSTYSKKKKSGLGEVFQLWKDFLPWSCVVFVPFLLIIWIVMFDEDPGMGEQEQDIAAGQDIAEQEVP